MLLISRLRRARAFAVAGHLGQPIAVLQVDRHRRAAELDDAVVVELLQRARRAGALEVFGRGIGVEVHREQLALDQVGLGRLAQPDRDVGLAHGEVELLVGGDQRDADVGEQIHEFAEPRRQPMDAHAGRGRHLQLAMRLLAAVGELGARRLELHEHVMGGAVEQLALLGEDQPAGVAVEQRDRQFLLERADLPRHRRLRQTELLAGMREAAGFRRGVKHLQLVPVHSLFSIRHGAPFHSAACCCCAPCARNRSASSAAMQPRPGGGHRLAVDVVGHVAGGEQARHRGRGRIGRGPDVAVRLHLDLAGDQLGRGRMADGDEHAVGGHLLHRAGLDVAAARRRGP